MRQLDASDKLRIVACLLARGFQIRVTFGAGGLLGVGNCVAAPAVASRAPNLLRVSFWLLAMSAIISVGQPVLPAACGQN